MEKKGYAKVTAREKKNGRKGREWGKKKPSPFSFILLTTQTTPIKPLFLPELGWRRLVLPSVHLSRPTPSQAPFERAQPVSEQIENLAN